MDRLMAYDVYYRVQHRHKDGSWGDMEEAPSHGVAAHDPERRWGVSRVFRCTSCEEGVMLVPPGEEAAPHEGE
jgi:hypothetical protein